MAAVALYKTLGAPSPLQGHQVYAGGAGEAFHKTEVISLADSNDQPDPDGGNPVMSGAAGSRKAAEHRRLAQALRANLGRRKAQKMARRKQTGDASESKTPRGEGAQIGASTKHD